MPRDVSLLQLGITINTQQHLLHQLRHLLCNNVCRSNWNDNCFCARLELESRSIDGATYTNTTGVTNVAAAAIQLRLEMLRDVSLLN
jgi:hypothetical protein